MFSFSRTIVLLSVVAISLAAMAAKKNSEKTSGAPALALPKRTPAMMSGSVFAKITANMSAEQREQRVYNEIMKGNVPKFIRRLVPLTIEAANGTSKDQMIVWVMPDYLAVGSDTDFLRVPLSPVTAQKIADKLSMSLPTTKLVDEIFANATVRIAPQPLAPGAQMTSSDYFAKHNRMIEKSLSRVKDRSVLVAGQKKDVVLSPRLRATPDRVAIYGWHRAYGNAIQPLSLVHDKFYADYSHGIRFVSRQIKLNNKPADLLNVLRDKKYSALLLDEPKDTRPVLSYLQIASL